MLALGTKHYSAPLWSSSDPASPTGQGVWGQGHIHPRVWNPLPSRPRMTYLGPQACVQRAWGLLPEHAWCFPMGFSSKWQMIPPTWVALGPRMVDTLGVTGSDRQSFTAQTRFPQAWLPLCTDTFFFFFCSLIKSYQFYIGTFLSCFYSSRVISKIAFLFPFLRVLFFPA